jgi:SH3-like domain-containing protein
MIRLALLAGLTALALMACSRSTPLPEPVPTEIPIIEPSPTPTATIVPTPTLPQVTVRVRSERVNCRFGPGTVYGLINELSQGQSLRAVGRNDASTWWYVRDPGNPGGFCWISVDLTEVQGDTDGLPVVQPPFVTVTNVDLRVEPNRIVVGCNQFPQTVFFEARVTTNGPTLFEWNWVVSTGVTSNVGTLIFEEAGTQVINEYYQINSPNEYWVKLNVLTPNEMVRQVTFPVNCTP